MQLQVSFTLPRDRLTVPLVRHLMVSMLQQLGVTADCVDEVSVALSEACTNAYKHAEIGETYDVAISLVEQTLAIDVIDMGRGARRIARKAGEVTHDPHAESGRGVSLIRALTDSVTFDSLSGDGTAVHMLKYLSWQEGAHGKGPQVGSRTADDVDRNRGG